MATWSDGSPAASAVGRGPARQLVVEAARRQERPIGAEHASRPARRRGDSSHQLGASPAPACSPIHSANSPTAANPTPQTGLRCCCVSSSSPTALTSRSRWTASCGTRAIGSCTSTSVVVPSRGDQPPGDAEVAIEPRVVQDAAVHLDGELLPTEPPASGCGFTRRQGESVWPPTMRNGSDGVGRAGRDPPGDQRAVTDDVAGRRYVGPGVGLVEAARSRSAGRWSIRRRATATVTRRGRR